MAQPVPAQLATISAALEDVKAETGAAAIEDMIEINLESLADETRCAVCLGVIKDARLIAQCMHRFCAVCIEKWLRLSKESVCPQCRKPMQSRRDCRPDPRFDRLVAMLYSDVGKYEEQIYEASADVMQKAYAEGAKIRQQAEARKAALASRSGRGGGGGSKSAAAGGGRSGGGGRGGSAAAKLPWTLTAGPLPTLLPRAGSVAAAAAAGGAENASANGGASPAESPSASLAGNGSASPAGTATDSDGPLQPVPKRRKKGKKGEPPGPPRVPLLQSGLGLLPTLLPAAPPRPKPTEQKPSPAATAVRSVPGGGAPAVATAGSASLPVRPASATHGASPAEAKQQQPQHRLAPQAARPPAGHITMQIPRPGSAGPPGSGSKKRKHKSLSEMATEAIQLPDSDVAGSGAPAAAVAAAAAAAAAAKAAAAPPPSPAAASPAAAGTASGDFAPEAPTFEPGDVGPFRGTGVIQIPALTPSQNEELAQRLTDAAQGALSPETRVALRLRLRESSGAAGLQPLAAPHLSCPDDTTIRDLQQMLSQHAAAGGNRSDGSSHAAAALQPQHIAIEAASPLEEPHRFSRQHGGHGLDPSVTLHALSHARCDPRAELELAFFGGEPVG